MLGLGRNRLDRSDLQMGRYDGAELPLRGRRRAAHPGAAMVQAQSLGSQAMETLGPEGDKINALLAAAGHNLRLILKRITLLFARILGAVVRFLASGARIRAVSAGQSAFSNTWLGPGRPATSMA